MVGEGRTDLLCISPMSVYCGTNCMNKYFEIVSLGGKETEEGTNSGRGEISQRGKRAEMKD